MNTAEIKNETLFVTGVFAAQSNRVFEHLIEASNTYASWCHKDCKSIRVDVQLKVGGCFNHHLSFPSGEESIVRTISQYEPFSKLVFKRPDSEYGRIQITATEFEASQTRIELIHQGPSPEAQLLKAIFAPTGVSIATEDYCLKTNQAAWLATFDKLAELVDFGYDEPTIQP